MKLENSVTAEKIIAAVKKNKYVFLVLLFGVFLLLLPSKKAESGSTATQTETSVSDDLAFSQENIEEKLESLLSKIDGAGKVEVMLSVKGGSERVIAMDTQTSSSESGGDEDKEVSTEQSESAVIISTGSGTDDAVTLKYIYPEYIGAVIVAEGAGSAAVRLDITEAVSALTGLTTSNIKVVKMK